MPQDGAPIRVIFVIVDVAYVVVVYVIVIHAAAAFIALANDYPTFAC